MIAIDTNVLVHAHRIDSELHEQAFALLSDLCEGLSPWAIPWQCLYEFLAVVTRDRIFNNPSTPEEAIAFINVLKESASLVLLKESPEDTWTEFQELLKSSKVTSNKIHDARIAFLCQKNSVDKIYTLDRNFLNLPGLTVENPFL